MSAASAAPHRPRTGGRPGRPRTDQSRLRRPCSANSRDRLASRARASTTTRCAVPSGMATAAAIRNSLPWVCVDVTPVWAGSLGCSNSVVTSCVCQACNGVAARSFLSWWSSCASNRPIVRHTFRGRAGCHSRTRYPCAARSCQHSALPACNPVTVAPKVPTGTCVVVVTRNSMFSPSGELPLQWFRVMTSSLVAGHGDG